MKEIVPAYRPFGPRSILIEWPARIDPKLLEIILNNKFKIEKYYIKVNVDIINTYNTITVFYNIDIDNIYKEISVLKDLINSEDLIQREPTTLWKIPVCYTDNFALDIEEISKEKGLTKSEIIGLHTRPKYQIYFFGFLPGFLYLGGLSESLFYPRKSSPRITIPSGAVGIGGNQTGIYPQVTAGGWNIIGNSPISFFDRKMDPPCFMKPGDLVTFKQISYQEHQEISNLVAYKRYQIESEVLNA